MTESCKCGSGRNFDSCCEPLILGKQLASNPEALMRSRYVAYTLADIDYIQKTMRGEALQHFSFEDSKSWSQNAVWQGLDVLQAPEVQGDEGEVEFKAYYQISGIDKCLHENSAFKKVDGKWYYVGNKMFRMTDKQETKTPKIGRNDPCFCGSGKKYKKCCYALNQGK